MTLNGCGVRNDSQALFMSPNTVLKTLRAAAAAIPGLPVSSKVRDLKINEFWSFVGSKRRPRWTWYGLDRQRKGVVLYVNGRRTDQECRRLMKQIQGEFFILLEFFWSHIFEREAVQALRKTHSERSTDIPKTEFGARKSADSSTSPLMAMPAKDIPIAGHEFLGAKINVFYARGGKNRAVKAFEELSSCGADAKLAPVLNLPARIMQKRSIYLRHVQIKPDYCQPLGMRHRAQSR